MCGVVGVVNIVLAIVDFLRANGDGVSGCYMLSKCVDVFSSISDT